MQKFQYKPDDCCDLAPPVPLGKLLRFLLLPSHAPLTRDCPPHLLSCPEILKAEPQVPRGLPPWAWGLGDVGIICRGRGMLDKGMHC